MKKRVKIALLSVFTLSFSVLAKPTLELYKSPSCGCCAEWASIMEAKGYQVNVHLTRDWTSIKSASGMPAQLQSCHTATIDGYLIEGHVPEAEIARLLKEKPTDISGLSAPGMPAHSPGMAPSGEPYKDFDVVAFDQSGNTTVYKKY